MLSFKEWRKVEATTPKKKKKDTNDEQRSSQTYGEGGNLYQQGQVARGNSEVTQQTIHVFAVPEL
jgi:triphosphoribosyl-dephospho-CoA synthetase